MVGVRGRAPVVVAVVPARGAPGTALRALGAEGVCDAGEEAGGEVAAVLSAHGWYAFFLVGMGKGFGLLTVRQ